MSGLFVWSMSDPKRLAHVYKGQPFGCRLVLGVNLDLGWALARALVEAWYVGQKDPCGVAEVPEQAHRLLSHTCRIATVLVDSESSPKVVAMNLLWTCPPNVCPHAACIRRAGLSTVTARPRSWGRGEDRLDADLPQYLGVSKRAPVRESLA
ncbi:hypothetical protein CC86DRAFT_8331 [Ophiobolus disseminans]|uniref:Uncharacterized protein n=1 Tax=Ophiobolus disseminans TaxID=1469910 RepID=A0A6A7AJB0_9PLEO|nr:hypothetical protein CC86DRAFT_8331 [Ophiobolus disseminans]